MLNTITKRLAAAVVAALCVATPAFCIGESVAVYLTGNDLLRRFNTDPQFAAGYVAGVFDAARQSVPSNLKECASNQVELQQVVDIVKKELDNHPESRHAAANVIVRIAAANAFRCAPKS